MEMEEMEVTERMATAAREGMPTEKATEVTEAIRPGTLAMAAVEGTLSAERAEMEAMPAPIKETEVRAATRPTVRAAMVAKAAP